ncbi:MAG: FHA domain-containing protein [Pseudomonadales bacterium]|nr:FHA domain-containing protein [Pseudomonadales bacterium]
METLVISLGERRAGIAEIVRGGDSPITLGRALSNDVVLTAPYVGPRHLRFFKRDGHWHAQALDDINPLLVNDTPVGNNAFRLEPGDRLSVGRTQLEVYHEGYQVQPARKLLLSSWLYRSRTALALALLATLAVALLDAVLDYYEYSPALKWEGLLATALSTTALIMVWAAMWALVGRLTRHQAHYSIQLLVTALVSALISLAILLPSYVDYWFSDHQLAGLIGYVLAVLLLALLLRWNLYYATHPDRPRLQAIILAVVCVGAYIGVSKLQQAEYDPNPRYSASLKPPFALWRAGVPAETFLSRSNELALRVETEAATVEELAATNTNIAAEFSPGLKPQ